MPDFAPALKDLGKSGIGVAAAPTGGMGLALDAKGRVPLSAAPAIPRCRVYNSANLAIATAATTAVTFDSERYDSEDIHSTAANTSRLTCKTAGIYDIFATAWFAAAAGGTARIVSLRLNGATTIADTMGPFAAGFQTRLSLATHYSLAVDDYVELAVFQDSGGNLNIESQANRSPEFGMAWVGPIP